MIANKIYNTITNKKAFIPLPLEQQEDAQVLVVVVFEQQAIF